jgi:hypothetical protein
MHGHLRVIPLTNDYRDILFALYDEKVEFLVVGAYAMSFYGSPRATGDLDILINATPENAIRVWRALLRFGAPLSGLSVEELATPKITFRMGRAPNCIDILTDIDGIAFANAWKNHTTIRLEEREIPVIGIDDLLANKIAAGRPKDLADVAWIKQHLSDQDRP